MRTLAFLKKTFLENVREWKILSLTLVFAPFFVYLMYGYYHASPSTYTLLVVNRDAAAGALGGRAAGDLIAAWKSATRVDGGAFFQVVEVPSADEAVRRLAAREADLAVEIPAGFSARLDAFASGASATPPQITNRASESNLRGTVAMAYSDF
ncbi:MAG: hypothetical protein H6Q09_628, partial [Acidobacteria bacterium]|nr:hypothetical protein [Acidobacteriota bacterium]